MNRRILTVSLTLIVLVVSGLVLSTIATGVVAQSDETPLPEVETAVAATLTAVAPTFESIPPTRTARPSPTPTVTLTPSSTPTPTPTSTASATLSEVEKIAGETLTAIFIDQSILQVWIEWDDGRRHDWHRELPDDLRAASRENAELVVRIEEEQRFVREQGYGLFGVTHECDVPGYRTVYQASLIDPRDDELLAEQDFEGPMPIFPSRIDSCDTTVVGGPPGFTRRFVDWIAPYAYLLGAPTPTPTPSPVIDENFQPHTRYVVGTNELQIRACPGWDCDVVGKLEPRERFFATSRALTDPGAWVWYSFVWEDQEVWISGYFTSDEPPSDY
jgi:hypothetical protein